MNFFGKELLNSLVAFLPGTLIGFLMGFSVAHFLDGNKKLDQQRLFSYMILSVWVLLILLESLTGKVSVSFAVHLMASVPLAHVYEVDFRNILWNK